MPAFVRVRAYATDLNNICNQREIVTTVSLFAEGNNQKFPPSVALCEQVGGSWRWQDPRKICTTEPLRNMQHRSLSDYLGYYGEPIDPNARQNGTRYLYGSCEKGPRAKSVNVFDLHSSYWSYSDRAANSGDPPDLAIKLHAGYVDGHVGSYRPQETRVMDVSEYADGSKAYFLYDYRHPGQFFLPERAFR